MVIYKDALNIFHEFWPQLFLLTKRGVDIFLIIEKYNFSKLYITLMYNNYLLFETFDNVQTVFPSVFIGFCVG